MYNTHNQVCADMNKNDTDKALEIPSLNPFEIQVFKHTIC